MPKFKDELAWHGSQLLMQMFINNARKKEQLDHLIGLGKISWYSPLTLENFKEYKLNEFFEHHKEFDINKLNKEIFKIKSKWDAIGIAPDGTLVIVEAKAHTSEMEDKKKSILNRRLSKDFSSISNIIEKTMGPNAVWLEKYYQLANRYTYLDNLVSAGIPTKLIYIYFINDVTFGNTTKEDWEKYLNNIHINYSLPVKLEKNTIHVFYDMWNEKNN